MDSLYILELLQATILTNSTHGTQNFRQLQEKVIHPATLFIYWQSQRGAFKTYI